MSIASQINKLRKDLDKIIRERHGISYDEYKQRMEARERQEEQLKGVKEMK